MTILSRALCRFLALILLFGATRQLWAHPMGNFSVNHYSRITVDNDGIQIRYFIDLAEIPTYQELQEANIEVTDVVSRRRASSR